MFKPCAIVLLAAIITPLSALAYTQQDADACTGCIPALPSRHPRCGTRGAVPGRQQEPAQPACRVVFSRRTSAADAPLLERQPYRRSNY